MKTPKPSVGKWRITHMDEWDQDFVDLVVPGHVAIREDGTGAFQFGAVQGGGNYQTMLNDALRSYIEQQDQPLEEVLRRVVREELQAVH